ncbi:MAG TPA: DivIVA domain-containing protein [Candidatus Anaerostipes avistercoris]|uniref:DivIVA domain-containing protein n=1 Tax=Candidatus Anaerostipes avistercoris TaxID=2838462 RepID=A0A9D2PIE8_9FIRM|nr:DivIVA domain-containing protein [Candidatus Anaerostipes avistercoris]
MITPVEVLGKELKRGFGYKAVEVDEFLEDLAKDYESVYKENNELKEKVSALTENLNHYRTIEESLKKALVLAEQTSKETMENAVKAAENVEAEARQKAEEELRKAKQEAEQIRNSAKEDFEEEKNQHTAEMERYKGLIRKLESDYCSYKAKMKQIIGAQMEILDNPVYEMEFEVEEKEETKRQEENNGESES